MKASTLLKRKLFYRSTPASALTCSILAVVTNPGPELIELPGSVPFL